MNRRVSRWLAIAAVTVAAIAAPASVLAGSSSDTLL
jgi:hypothetical protein